ncbi:LCP family protein [Baekduia sp.]|jgi:LCP family protein required for cell wall assembly|uniref:LCP family protein n=1 Tax=Baekduia sp. TaxID=2600305 RepID=UPI002DFC46F8|nr:LCP family protein [Baekduia sp.]
MSTPSDPPPEYTKYRSGPGFLRRGPKPGEPLIGDLGAGPATPPRPPRTPSGPGLPEDDDRRGSGPARPRWRLPFHLPRRRHPRGPLSIGRVIKWLVLAAIGWVALSLVLFLISAQLQQGDLSGKVDLGGAGFPLTSPNTILVLGSDARPKDSKEPGASSSGSRSDSILLMRVGGGKNARLSIPRDTVVDIPGHGRNKINAAYAFGGPALAVQTLEQYLGIQVNHLIEVNFNNFPQLIDAMGGITYKGGCVVSKINGGFKNGGYTLRLKEGKTHINGKQALALARTRHNDCNKAESDLTRARRQQKILSAMKSRLLSPFAFPRLPWIAWNTPKALRSDMSGPTLLGLFGALATSGSPAPRILKPDGVETAPDGGAGLHVSDAEKARDVARFLRG